MYAIRSYYDQLNEELAVADTVLYRRGNFNGTFDQIIVDAMRAQADAQVALSPGFRWGCSVLPGDPITMDDLLTQTCMTYPETYVREMTGAARKARSMSSPLMTIATPWSSVPSRFSAGTRQSYNFV